MKIIGLMSGTSLDGLDIAYCEFQKLENTESWHYKILCAETINYSAEWIHTLRNLDSASALALAQTGAELSYYFGEEVNKFIKNIIFNRKLLRRTDKQFFTNHTMDLQFISQTADKLNFHF